jgi:hypothetical protein
MEGKDMVTVQDNAVPGTAVSAGVNSSARCLANVAIQQQILQAHRQFKSSARTGGGAHLRRRVR